MAHPLDYAAAAPGRSLAQVDPIIDASDMGGAIGQILDFMSRQQAFRAGVASTGFFPFSAICRLLITFPDGSSGQGSGFYIAPDRILTAGHCVWDNGTLAQSITVEPGRLGGFTHASFTVSAADLEVHPTYRNSGDRGFDLGLIHVSTPPPHGSFEMINYSPLPDTPVAVCGYGMGPGVARDRPHLDIDRTRRLSAGGEVMEYNLQTRGGTSGSPVFVDFANNRSGGYSASDLPVMGVHVARGDQHHNRAVLLTPDKIDWARSMSGADSFGAQAFATRSIGGLPLVQQNRSRLGGLPLMPARQMAVPPHGRPFARSWIVVDTSDGMSVARRTFGHPTHDQSGRTTLTVRVPNMPEGGSVRWTIPDEADRRKVMFEAPDGTRGASASGTTVTLLALSGGHAAVDCAVRDASGRVVESNKYLVSAPQFVLVAFDDTLDAYLSRLGLGSRVGAIHAEIAAMLRHQYRDVNIRFVMPGDTLPVHLGRTSDPTFPGGVETDPAVFYLHLVGAEIDDPERSRDARASRPYEPGLIGRNHAPGEMDPPMHEHALSRVLVHRFEGFFPALGPIAAAQRGGGLSDPDQALVATLMGRIAGYIAAHELGHFMIGTPFGHDAAGGLMGTGSAGLARVSGMTATGGADPILTDAGRGASSGLSTTMRRTFEDELAIDPPLDAAGRRDRGRVGSFSLSRRPGWRTVPASRALTQTTIHLPGATVLDGWEAEALIAGFEASIRMAMSINPATAIFAPFVDIEPILAACDRFGVSLGFGPGLSAGAGGGFGFGAGIVFAPGRRIGFYSSRADVLGWIASGAISAQVTLVKGGPEAFGGDSLLVGVAVETIGWFDAGTIGMPIGAHLIVNDSGPIGTTLEFGVGVGVPTVSLIEVFAQDSTTVTTFGRHARALTTADPLAEARTAFIERAIEAGASPEDAAGAAAGFFG